MGQGSRCLDPMRAYTTDRASLGASHVCYLRADRRRLVRSAMVCPREAAGFTESFTAASVEPVVHDLAAGIAFVIEHVSDTISLAGSDASLWGAVTPCKLVDTTLINGLGWKARIPLREGLAEAYRWFVEPAERL